MSDVKYFQCFVCGKIFKSYAEMSEHVIKTHEEGREYLICPLAHCRATVRDLRSHFKTKHKYNKLPKGCQLRCAVWFDVNSPKKKKKTISFKEGNMVSLKNEGKEMHYRSNYEKEVYECLEKISEIIKYEVEPFHIKYYYKGKLRNYYPDLKIYFSDSRVEVWEIKPLTQMLFEQNQCKFEAANNYCNIRGWKFKTINEENILQLKRMANRGEEREEMR